MPLRQQAYTGFSDLSLSRARRLWHPRRVSLRDPEELGSTGVPLESQISAAAVMGAVELTVSELRPSVAYYRDVIGLEVLEQGPGRAVLGAGPRTLIVLAEEPGARPARGCTGLYHLALLVPGRQDLARWLAHAARDAIQLVGLSDHFVSEALYLSDPDGHGIEIYRDRPRNVWEGRVAERMTTLPLDVESLLGELESPVDEPFEGLPHGTVMGHVHFKVAAIDDTIAFHRDLLGFGLMAQLGPTAAFFGAGGYHHHVGANTWESAGGPAPPRGSAALRRATLVLPDLAERERILARLAAAGRPVRDSDDGPVCEDPSGSALLLAVR